ncbi:hypothetical protein JGY90_10215 [Staphylococcus xylosus]|uniref:hypothetical protein n=1 Tax=Staphylococcus xylosus TaxID=1288 RepID=UPI001CDCBAB2|nr:hypothetical protein [Staphylococcus xylosus]UBV34078.1 hypothetical protein JGY90_10215 [Staphylococcus xylosus]
MNLGLTILIWLMIIAIVSVFLIYGFAFIASVVLAIKGKRDFEKTKVKQQLKTESGRPSEETMESLFGKDYKTESGRLSPKQEKAPKPPRKDSE